MERIAVANYMELIGKLLASNPNPPLTSKRERNSMIVSMVDEWLVKKQKNKKFRITARSIEKDDEGYLMITIMYIE